MLYTRGADLGGGDVYTATLGSTAIHRQEYPFMPRKGSERAKVRTKPVDLPDVGFPNPPSCVVVAGLEHPSSGNLVPNVWSTQLQP